MSTILTILGTRPEIIKLGPILKRLAYSKFTSKVCSTSQHDNLAKQHLLELNIIPDYVLEGSKKVNLDFKLGSMLSQLSEVICDARPDAIIVQGDTLSTYVGALAAFYNKIELLHIEAGLRTNDINNPWPEEMHRTHIAALSTLHFAPTEAAKRALIKEGIPEDKIFLVGNTSIDAIQDIYHNISNAHTRKVISVVITLHRREILGRNHSDVCKSIVALASKFREVDFIYVLHPNPDARSVAIKNLQSLNNLILVDPMPHKEFIDMLNKCSMIITDSGGIQEEVSILGTPTVVLRNCTERYEGIESGTALLVSYERDSLYETVSDLLLDSDKLANLAKKHNSYGDGTAAEKIINILERRYLGEESSVICR